MNRMLAVLRIAVVVVLAVIVAGCEDRSATSKSDEKPATLEEFYPPGRKFRTAVISNFVGKAKNKNWMVSGVSSIDYESWIEFDTTVESNSGGRLVLLREFHKVRSALFATEKSYRFDFPEVPLLTWLQDRYEVSTSDLLPPTVRLALLALKEFDPEGQKTLDGLFIIKDRVGKLAESLGVAQFLPKEPLEARLRILEELEGVRVRITYAADGKIIQLESAGGGTLHEETRRLLKRGHGVLTDYSVFPNRDAAIGDEWEVDASELGILQDPFEGSLVGGHALLRRVKLEASPFVSEDAAANRLARLDLIGGRLTLYKDDKKTNRTGSLTPNGGYLVFDQDNLFVIGGVLHFYAEYEQLSKDHLLFEARFEGQVKATTHIHTELLK